MNTDLNKEITNGFVLNKNPKSFLALTVKTFLFLVPGIILGHYIDQYINKLKKQETFGKGILNYIILQTILSVVVVYCLIHWAKSYTKEIESKIVGVFFASLYFNMQTNYIDNIQHYLGFF